MPLTVKFPFFYTFVLNAVIECRDQERETLIWGSQHGCIGRLTLGLASTELDCVDYEAATALRVVKVKNLCFQ